MSGELKPCPFCGGEAKTGGYAIAVEGYWVSCTTCGVYVDGYPTTTVAVDAWNQRAHPTEGEEIARLREAATEALRQIEKYAEFFCDEDFDPTVDLLRGALTENPTP